MPRKARKTKVPVSLNDCETNTPANSPIRTPQKAKKAKNQSEQLISDIDFPSQHTRQQERGKPRFPEKEIGSRTRKSVCRALTQDEEDDLVAWLREKSLIYDKSSADFKLKEKKNRAWSAKEEELGLKPGDLSSIWYLNMRTQFSKLVKLSTKSGSGIGENTERQQWLLNSVGFLRPYLLKLRNQRGSIFAEKRTELASDDTDDIDAASDISESTTSTTTASNLKAAGAISSLTSEIELVHRIKLLRLDSFWCIECAKWISKG